MDTDVKCPLPVVRVVLDDDGEVDRQTFAIQPCGESVFVADETCEYVVMSAPGHVVRSFGCRGWRVECQMGHVLLVPDHEGNEYAVLNEPDDNTIHMGLRILTERLWPELESLDSLFARLEEVLPERPVDLDADDGPGA